MSTSIASSADIGQIVANLKPVFAIKKLVTQVFDDMGFGPVESYTDTSGRELCVDFSVLHFVLLPQKSAWIDFLLEVDRPSSQALYQMFSGVKEQSDADLEDVLRETMNMIHGVVKVAFKEDGTDVIIPVVPQSVASDRIMRNPGICSTHSRHIFKLPGVILRLSLVARISPIVRKSLKDLSVATVLAEPLSPEGSEDLIIVKKGSMLNKRVLEKVRDMANFDGDARTLPVIEPSPYARLINND